MHGPARDGEVVGLAGRPGHDGEGLGGVEEGEGALAGVVGAGGGERRGQGVIDVVGAGVGVERGAEGGRVGELHVGCCGGGEEGEEEEQKGS